MTDQANGQSGAAEQASDNTEADLFAAFQNLRGEPSKDQAVAEQEETPEGDAGEIPDEDGAEADTGQPRKIRVRALEGDGFEELSEDELKSQRLMHADYTRKTQAIAEQRKVVEAKQREVEQAMTARLQQVDDHVAMLGRAIQSFEAEVDWDALRQSDPGTYVEQRERQAQRLRQFNAAKAQADEQRKIFRQQKAAEEAQRLVEAIPEWLDKGRARAEATAIRDGVSAYGFSSEEFDQVIDHRLVLMARDAIEFRKLKAKASEMKATVGKAPQLAKPGGSQPGNPDALRAHRAIQRATTTGSVDDMAAAFGAFRRGRK